MALTLNEQKQFQLDCKRKLAQAKTPLEKLRYVCLSRGASGINGLGRQFRIIDDDNNKQISKEEFAKVCKEFGTGLTNEEVDSLFAEIDRDGSGSLNFDEFLEALRPPMPESRRKLVELAFKKLDKTGDGVITVDDLKGVYNARSHPKYQNGELTEQDVFREYLKTFESRGEVDGKVTWQEFLNYYSGISSSIDEDVYFDLMLRNAYKL
ncbi:unnamed protein product [Mesocestoides corti]|uniref:Calcyphosin-like protein n=1 Tax=Mesocestoides corti TaxID=53468 RepID=A0A0R3U1I9_MESCO|nr:unnamed protein product [Mesocestoides corti]